MEARAILERLASLEGDAVYDFQDAVPKDGPRDACFHVRSERLGEVMWRLRDAPELAFDFLQNVTAVDWPKREVIEVVYHLYSYAHDHEVCVKTETPRAAPHVPSVVALWPTANWLEREQFDLFGVAFDGHPDLRRLLMPDDWVGHPMRKDFIEAKSYRGMPTSRPSPLDLLLAHDRTHAPRPTVASPPASDAPPATPATAPPKAES